MLKEINMRPLTARELKPERVGSGAVGNQARGLSGHLDQIWPDVRDSAWLGGDRDGWERLPYWLDGCPSGLPFGGCRPESTGGPLYFGHSFPAGGGWLDLPL